MTRAVRPAAKRPALGIVAVLGVVLALAVGTSESRALAPDLAGVYICEGTAADGVPYRGYVRIALHDEVYVVRWMFARGDAYTGIGVVNGSAFAVTYVGATPGVAAYTIEDPARLVGTWTVAGANGRAYSETLTKVVGEVRDPTDLRPPRPTRAPPPGMTTI